MTADAGIPFFFALFFSTLSRDFNEQNSGRITRIFCCTAYMEILVYAFDADCWLFFLQFGSESRPSSCLRKRVRLVMEKSLPNNVSNFCGSHQQGVVVLDRQPQGVAKKDTKRFPQRAAS